MSPKNAISENPRHDTVCAKTQPSENRVAHHLNPRHDYVLSLWAFSTVTVVFQGCTWKGCGSLKAALVLDLHRAQPLRFRVAFGASATPGVSLDTRGLRTLVGKG